MQQTKITAIDTSTKQNSSASFASAVVNVQHFTQFIYEGNQVYVYSAKLNDEYTHDPLKWSFYYVPVLHPIKSSNETEWSWAVKKEVRMKLIIGNDQVEDAARRAISRRFSSDISANYSQFWVVAPLMIDSITAFIITLSGEPVEGVIPCQFVHPNALTITFRYECSNENTARNIVEKLINDEYEIEVHFYFAGFRHVSTNIIAMTAENLKSVLSKTIADGGNSYAKYIHRAQKNRFINVYTTNVKKLIYMEKSDSDPSALTNGLEERFQSLFQQGKFGASNIKFIKLKSVFSKKSDCWFKRVLQCISFQESIVLLKYEYLLIFTIKYGILLISILMFLQESGRKFSFSIIQKLKKKMTLICSLIMILEIYILHRAR